MNNISHSNAYYVALRNRFKTLFNRYKVNTLADGGTIRNDSITQAYMKFCQTNRISDSIKLAIFPEAGIKTIGGKVSKAYGLPTKLLSGDSATQATTGNQPYLSGNIAPNENLSLKNPNGGSNYMTHPTISFGANESWSVTTVINRSSNFTEICGTVGGDGIYIDSDFNFISVTSGTPSFVSQSAYTVNTKSVFGKNAILTVIHTPTNIIFYLNGVEKGIYNITTSRSFTTNLLNNGRNSFSSNSKYYAHIIRAQALTATEVLNEYNFLKPYYPEIENVTIGTQTWATSNCEMAATSQGNLIANVTDNTIWASSQTLYDNAYAAQSGTVEQKTYAAVKAAAMWCYYNNDVAIGAVYGKLYNWFAVKLLQMDIDYYNAVPGNTAWGWRVPTQTDFQTLSTYLGGDAVSGGKLKLAGTTYWNSPNTGADNSSGFSALGGGRRLNGPSDLLVFAEFVTIDLISSTNYRTYRLSTSATNFYVDNETKIDGTSLRLIKS